jgi:glycosyltransferase involved in cell wall biosynthesis
VKLLYVVHYFLPYHQAGTEIYTYTMAAEMAKRHEVTILTTEDADITPGEFRVERDKYENIPVIRIYRSEPVDFKASYKSDKMDDIFAGLVDELQPDMAHFQHLYRLSIGFIDVLAAKHIPRVLTLADYWFICPPIILLKPGFVRCTGPEKGVVCASCGNAVGEEFAGSFAARLLGSSPAQQQAAQMVHRLKNSLPDSVVQIAKNIKDRAVATAPAGGKRMDLLCERYDLMMKALKKVNLILAPSRFLRETHVEAGVPPYIISYSDYGFDMNLFPRRPRRKYEPPLKVGFMGTIVSHKGVHVLVEAMRHLKGAELHIWGDLTHFPAYVNSLKKAAEGLPVIFEGRYEHKDVSNILSGFDVLVVPSLWWENSPLTIHEAFLMGVPVIASRCGGMGELVADEMFLFEPEDSLEIARLLQNIVNRPALLTTFGNRRGQVKTIEENALEIEEVYDIVIQRMNEEIKKGEHPQSPT